MTVVEHAPRIAPLEPPYSPGVRAALEKWMVPGSEVEPLRLFRTLMRHESLASRMRPLGAGILGPNAVLEPRLREVMIHRTCALTGAEYEWGVHVVGFGRPLGLSEDQLRSSASGGPEDSCWGEREAIVLRLADELHATSTISQELWQMLEREFDSRCILELLITAGWYHLISYLCNGLTIEREEWAARFPAHAQHARS